MAALEHCVEIYSSESRYHEEVLKMSKTFTERCDSDVLSIFLFLFL